MKYESHSLQSVDINLNHLPRFFIIYNFLLSNPNFEIKKICTL